MLSYSLNNVNNLKLYEYIYACIKKDILNGTLKPNDKLPSKRAFANNMGISVITVENAYSQLLAEGYIYSEPRKGFFVSEISQLPTPLITDNTDRHIKLKQKNDFIIADFTSNQTNHGNFPFASWNKILRKVISENRDLLMTNPPAGGTYELRNAIAGHLRSFRNMNVQPEQIIIGAGTEYLYGLIIQLLGHDKKYAVENPGYNKIAKIYLSNNVCCKYIDIDRQGIILEDIISEKADIIHISPSHHFPTGIVMPIQRRYDLLNWANEDENRYIIEDDYDSEFRFSGRMIPTLQSIDNNEKVIYINTFTKSLASTIRISYMVLPPKLVREFYTRLSFYSSAVSNFEQLTLAEFISGGFFERHINRMRNYYRKQRDLLLDAIYNSPLASKISISEADSGLHFLMHINTELSDVEITDRANKANIKISSLSQYYLTPTNDKNHYFIINYSSIDEKNIKESINILYNCIQ